MKKGKLCYFDRSQTMDVCDIPDGIIAYVTRECGGNVHDRHVVDVTSGLGRSYKSKATVGITLDCHGRVMAKN
jgi:hypothetical protein